MKINTDLLREIQHTLKSEPKRLDMETWVEHQSGANAPQCGTAGCIAGWTAILVHQKKVGGSPLEAYRELSMHYKNVKQIASRALHLTAASRNRLFFVEHWPRKFQKAYHNATTQFDKVRATVDRIDYFIKTNGK